MATQKLRLMHKNGDIIHLETESGLVLMPDGKTLDTSLSTLQTAIDGKAAATHTHTPASIGAAAATHSHSEYALTSHTHSNYALTSHTHSQYAATNHTHSEYMSASYTESNQTDLITLDDFFVSATQDFNPITITKNSAYIMGKLVTGAMTISTTTTGTSYKTLHACLAYNETAEIGLTAPYISILGDKTRLVSLLITDICGTIFTSTSGEDITVFPMTTTILGGMYSVYATKKTITPAKGTKCTFDVIYTAILK